MARRNYTLVDYKTANLNGAQNSYYVGDTFADLPSSGMAAGDLAFDKATGAFYVATSATVLSLVQPSAANPFTKGATFYDPAGVTAVTLVVWTAPFACTVTAIKGYRTGGTGATVNAFRGTAGTPLRSANLSLTSADTWMDGGSVQNTAFASGNSLLIGVTSVTGTPTQVACQVNFTRP